MEGQADDIAIAAFDRADEGACHALYAIGTGFVEGFSAVQIAINCSWR